MAFSQQQNSTIQEAFQNYLAFEVVVKVVIRKDLKDFVKKEYYNEKNPQTIKRKYRLFVSRYYLDLLSNLLFSMSEAENANNNKKYLSI